MKDKSRKVFYSAIQVREMMSNEPVTNRTLIKSQVFDNIEHAYRTAEANGSFDSFQQRFEEDGEVLMISMLHYEGDYLCGMIGRGRPQIDRFLRERNPETFAITEIEPGFGNLFEEYSYFVISCNRLQIAFLTNPAVSTNIPKAVIWILRKNLGGAVPYEFEESKLLDHDIKAKLKQMKGTKVAVKGTLVQQEQCVMGGIPSLKIIENALGSKISATISIKAYLSRVLTDEEIDIITESACVDDGFSSFTFTDEQDADKEIIDVIKNQTYLSAKISLTPGELHHPEAVWKKICESFASR